MKELVEGFEIVGQYDSFFEAVVGADQEVVGADFPGVSKVASEFGFTLKRDPLSFEVPLPVFVFLDVRGGQPTEGLVPDESSFQLSGRKRGDPAISEANEPEQFSGGSGIGVGGCGSSDEVVGVAGVSVLEDSAAEYEQCLSVLAVLCFELALPLPTFGREVGRELWRDVFGECCLGLCGVGRLDGLINGLDSRFSNFIYNILGHGLETS